METTNADLGLRISRGRDAHAPRGIRVVLVDHRLAQISTDYEPSALIFRN